MNSELTIQSVVSLHIHCNLTLFPRCTPFLHEYKATSYPSLTLIQFLTMSDLQPCPIYNLVRLPALSDFHPSPSFSHVRFSSLSDLATHEDKFICEIEVTVFIDHPAPNYSAQNLKVPMVLAQNDRASASL
jgi:hypothetical protein